MSNLRESGNEKRTIYVHVETWERMKAVSVEAGFPSASSALRDAMEKWVARQEKRVGRQRE